MQTSLHDVLACRQSIRKFNGRQIADEELQGVLEAANAAPIAMRLHGDLKIIVVQKKALLEELDQHAVKFFKEAKGMERSTAIFHTPTLIIITAKRNNDTDIMRGLYCSAACMLENMILAATEKELGNVYLMGVTAALNHNEKLRKKLGIADEYEAMSAVALGRTDVKFLQKDLSVPRFEVLRI